MRYGRCQMPCTPDDVLRAVQALAYRGEAATTDAVAVDLATSHDDVAPMLVAVMRQGGLQSVKRATGASVWVLTEDGERAIADDD